MHQYVHLRLLLNNKSDKIKLKNCLTTSFYTLILINMRERNKC